MNRETSISNNNVILIALLAVLVLAGFATWIYQLSAGLIVTNLTNPVSWGLYIIVFAFLVGLSAGGLIVSAAAYVFNSEKLEKIAPYGVIVAMAAVIGAMAIIIPDMGRPDRLWHLFTMGHFSSPILWDIIILLTYLVIGGVELWLLFGKRWRDDPEGRRKALRKAAFIVLPVAVLVHSVTAWIFGLQVGRPFWFTALMAPMFISSALVSGLGLLILVLIALRVNGKLRLSSETLPYLGGMLASFIAIDLFLLFCDLLTMVYGEGAGGLAALRIMFSGGYAVMFWVQVLLCMVLPFVLLALKDTRSSIKIIGLASLLAVVGVFLKRVIIILPAFQGLNVNYAPGVSTGRFAIDANSFTSAPTYFPTWVEIVIATSAIAGVLLLIILGINWLTSGQKKNVTSSTEAATV